MSGKGEDSPEGKAERKEIDGLFFLVTSSAELLGFQSDGDEFLIPRRAPSSDDSDSDRGGEKHSTSISARRKKSYARPGADSFVRTDEVYLGSGVDDDEDEDDEGESDEERSRKKKRRKKRRSAKSDSEGEYSQEEKDEESSEMEGDGIRDEAAEDEWQRKRRKRRGKGGDGSPQVTDEEKRVSRTVEQDTAVLGELLSVSFKKKAESAPSSQSQSLSQSFVGSYVPRRASEDVGAAAAKSKFVETVMSDLKKKPEAPLSVRRTSAGGDAGGEEEEKVEHRHRKHRNKSRSRSRTRTKSRSRSRSHKRSIHRDHRRRSRGRSRSRSRSPKWMRSHSRSRSRSRSRSHSRREREKERERPRTSDAKPGQAQNSASNQQQQTKLGRKQSGEVIGPTPRISGESPLVSPKMTRTMEWVKQNASSIQAKPTPSQQAVEKQAPPSPPQLPKDPKRRELEKKVSGIVKKALYPYYHTVIDTREKFKELAKHYTDKIVDAKSGKGHWEVTPSEVDHIAQFVCKAMDKKKRKSKPKSAAEKPNDQQPPQPSPQPPQLLQPSEAKP